MKRPERPEALFAVIVALVALLLPGGIANAAPTANGNAVSGDKAEAESAAKKKKADSPKDAGKIRAQLKDLADDYKKSADRVGNLEKQQTRLAKEIRATKKQVDDSRARVVHTAQAAYTTGNVDSTVVALTSNQEADEVVDQMTTLTVLAERDDLAITNAHRDRKRLETQQRTLVKAVKSAKQEKASLESKRKKLNAALLEAARALESRQDGKASRSAKVSGGGACPVGQPRQMSDTWGASRSGGRAHEGTDILAPMGTPIYAVEDGTVTRAGNNGLGGIIIILKGKSGDSYYYAHQQANLVGTGAKVVAGQNIAKVGMTGNAQGTVPHLHFERWPGGGNPVNPWPFVKALCG